MFITLKLYIVASIYLMFCFNRGSYWLSRSFLSSSLALPFAEAFVSALQVSSICELQRVLIGLKVDAQQQAQCQASSLWKVLYRVFKSSPKVFLCD